MKKKACKKCKKFVDSGECPTCKTNNFSTNWKGRLYILDAKNSFIAKEIGINEKGEYAIKVS
ncbi:DNA-directed RNA polymerase subunit E'' [Candidatus Woesearchaeota archaeon]|nr:DNA-directed RNA polymerase subunit E'' [Candidatus Woesearchaeota archaeon]